MKKFTALIFGTLLPCIALGQLEGAIDAHVHSAPDSVPRSVTAIEVAQLARRHRMRGILYKNHYAETASLAFLVAQVVPEVEAYGGIALNRAVGGINLQAVERMAMMTGGHGRIVWLPTFDSEHGHLTNTPNPNFVPVSRNGELRPEVLELFELMVSLDLALATGHSSPQENLLIIRAARAAGIERIVVTHPSSYLVAMPTDMQREAARLGAYLEYPISLALPNGEIPFEEFAQQIRDVGPEDVVLSTDLGQAGNPVHTDGLALAVGRLLEWGFSQREIDRMIRINPARLLGVE
ncbi:MAG: DUF6282 family protein [Gammaproteobacteria bacterium]|jgi:hypothetical protein